MDIVFDGSWTASASDTEAGCLVIVSKRDSAQVLLMGFEILEVTGRISNFLRRRISGASKVTPLDPIGLRRNLSSFWGAILSEHLMRVHDHITMDKSDVVAYTAWRYETLVAWGEASAAREIALASKISVHTIHRRLQLARHRGILKSPGAGARLGG